MNCKIRTAIWKRVCLLSWSMCLYVSVGCATSSTRQTCYIGFENQDPVVGDEIALGDVSQWIEREYNPVMSKALRSYTEAYRRYSVALMIANKYLAGGRKTNTTEDVDSPQSEESYRNGLEHSIRRNRVNIRLNPGQFRQYQETVLRVLNEETKRLIFAERAIGAAIKGY